ncbi:MAG TPA: hypothetical protein VLE97_10635 [Gaiellaceae bacterium]|nr:hypothetical protein [Gaiellaceae bacterium]
MTRILTVAAAVTRPRFLAGSHCVEFVLSPPKGCAIEADDGYWIRQIACCLLRQDPTEQPVLVERHRGFRSKPTDPWPVWRAILGSGIGPRGFYGSCALHLEVLLAKARLVPLAKSDRVPPEEPGWDPFKNSFKPDRLARERAAFEAQQ